MNRRSKFLVSSIVIILVLAPTFLARGSDDFPQEKIMNLINAGAKNINSGNAEKALSNLAEAKEVIASQMVDLYSGKNKAKIGELSFSIEGADDIAAYASVGEYYEFNVYVKLSNESNTIIKSRDPKAVGGVEMTGYAISPEENQIEERLFMDFDRLLPGVNKKIRFPFPVGLRSNKEFIPGLYTIMIRLEPEKGKTAFLKDEFTIKKGS